MKKKLLLFSVMALALCALFATGVSAAWNGTAAAGFAGGDGTAENPYQIATAEQLAYLAQSVNAGTTYEGQYIKLTADIALNDTASAMWTLTAKKWTPIGTYTDDTVNAPFSGTFDGDGHTVSGLYVSALVDATWMGYQGLFGYTYNANFKNVTIANADVTGANNVGALVGYARYNVTANAAFSFTGCTVKDSAVLGDDYVGGLVGQAYGYAKGNSGNKVTLDLSFTNCINTAAAVTGKSYVGGLVGGSDGKVYSSSYATVQCTFENCANDGTVSASYSSAGGMAGACYSTVAFTDCTNSGAVLDAYSAGGMVGCCDTATFTNCTNSGNVTSTADSSVYRYLSAGGMVGYCRSTAAFENCTNGGAIFANHYAGGMAGECTSTVTFTNCENSGVVTALFQLSGGVVGFCSTATFADCTNSGDVTAESGCAGGLMGRCNSTDTVENCENSGNITAKTSAGGMAGEFGSIAFTNCTNSGDIAAETNAGGMAGYGSSASLENCINSGEVTVSSISIYNNSYVGGMIGYCYSTATFANCTNSGAVTASSSYSYAGGIVGYLVSGSTVERCYNTGSMAAPTGTTTYVKNAGGIVGYAVKSVIRDCFNTGTFYGYQNVGGIVGYLEGGDTKPEAFLYNCYNLGGVNGMPGNASTPAKYIGGIVGQVVGKVQMASCYYLGGCAADDLGNMQNGMGSADCTAPTADTPGITVACTDGQMKGQATFAGFDFDTVWTMAGSVVYPYPKLQSVPYTGGGFTPGPLFSALPPVIAVQPLSVNATQNSAVTLSVSASSPDGGVLSYQWYVSETETGAGIPIPDAVGAVYTPSTATGGTLYYYVIVTNTNAAATDKTTAETKSAIASVFVSTDAQTPVMHVSVDMTSAVPMLSAAASVTDGGTLTYQWYVSDTENGVFTPIAGATAAFHAAHTESVTRYYYVTVTSVNPAASGQTVVSVNSRILAVTPGAAVGTPTPAVQGDINGDGVFDYYDVARLYAIHRGKAAFAKP